MTQTRQTGSSGLARSLRTIGQSLLVGAVLSIPVIGASIVANGLDRVARYGFERAIESKVEHREYDAFLVDKDEASLLGTHGKLVYGDFKLRDGSDVRIHDGAYVSEGKIWENSRMGGLQEGEAYKVSVVGNDTLGWTLLDAE